jgi:hypothetical protein
MSKIKRETLNGVRQLRYVPYVLVVLMIFFGGLSGCRPTPPPPAAHPSLLVEVEGTVKLKRGDWSTYTPVDFGTLVEYDDLLDVEGAATILCGDMTLTSFDSGVHDSPCPSGPGRLVYQGAHYRAVPSDVPYIHYPRNTLVLDDYPLLRWHDTGATDYTASLVQGGATIWKDATVVGNEVRYPADQDPLMQDKDYLLVVKDNDTGIGSGEDPARGIGFRVIRPTQKTALNAYCDAVTNLATLEPDQRDFALALCYATWEPEAGGRGVWGEAWLLLDRLAQTQDAPAVYLWMGDVLMKMTSPEDAETAYRTALQRAEVLGDVESQAVAQVGLWRVTAEAQYKDAAIELYQQLGDAEVIESLE